MPETVLPSANLPQGAAAKHKAKSSGERLSLILILLALICALSYEIVAIYGSNNAIARTNNSSTEISPPKSAKANMVVAPTAVSHIFIIVMENQPLPAILGSASAPYLNSLITRSAVATNYSAITHPSLPNYLALTSASTDGTTNDCNPPSAGCIVSVTNLADGIEASGRSWKAYAESMPSPCYALNYGSLYATRHVPFLYYADVINNTARCQAHIVPYSNLASDLASMTTTPNFAFITPNLCDDMHNCPISSGDSWLSLNVPPILNSPAFKDQPSLLVITWDEGSISNNTVGAIFAGSAAKAGYRSSASYNHYSLVHTIDYLWGLKPLTSNDHIAPLMKDMLVSIQ